MTLTAEVGFLFAFLGVVLVAIFAFVLILTREVEELRGIVEKMLDREIETMQFWFETLEDMLEGREQ